MSRNPFTSGLQGSFPSRVQSLGNSCSRTPSILPSSTNLHSSVPPYGFTQLGLRSHPPGSFVPETPSTSFSLLRSDKPVYATASIRPTGPCQPSTALTGPTFSYLRNPNPHVSGGFYDFHRRLHAGVGRSHGGFPDFGYLDLYGPQTPHQLSGAEGGSLCPKALGPSAPGPPGYDCYGQFDSSFVYQQTRRDPFPHLVTFDSRASPLVRGSEHYSQSKAHTRLSELDSRPPIPSESANFDRVVPTPPGGGTYLPPLGDTRSRHVRDSVEFPPSSVHVSNSGATSLSGGCSVSRLAGEGNVHVPSIPPAQQSHSEAQVHSGGRGNSHSPLVAESVVVSTPTTSLCGTPTRLSLSSRSSVPTGPEVYLGRKVIPSACMEALMRHYKAAGFSDEVSDSRQPLGDPPPIACTTIDGFASLDGPRGKGLIRLTPWLLR